MFEWTTVFRGAPGFETPYHVGYVDLPEGVRVFTQFVLRSDETLEIGQRVRWIPWVFGSRTGEDKLGYAFERILEVRIP